MCVQRGLMPVRENRPAGNQIAWPVGVNIAPNSAGGGKFAALRASHPALRATLAVTRAHFKCLEIDIPCHPRSFSCRR